MFSAFHNVFYEGLITFHFARITGLCNATAYVTHLARGKNALQKMKEWTSHSSWNFKNKALLMEAEMHYTLKNYDNATICYEESIKAAQEHKFIREEAVACELAGRFFLEREMMKKSCILFKKAALCYKKWGAFAVVRRIKEIIQRSFDTDVLMSDALSVSASLDAAQSRKRNLLQNV